MQTAKDTWEEERKAGNPRGKKNHKASYQSSKRSQHRNISLFNVSRKKKKTPKNFSKMPRNSLDSVATGEDDSGRVWRIPISIFFQFL